MSTNSTIDPIGVRCERAYRAGRAHVLLELAVFTEDGSTVWVPRADGQPRSLAKSMAKVVLDYSGCDVHWLDIRSVRKVWMRPADEDGWWGKAEDGRTECAADHPDAVPFWRVEA